MTRVVTVVIPTYNRGPQLLRAVRSCQVELPEALIVVVDDASTDDSVAQIKAALAPELAAGSVKLVVNAVNLGVTGSKNAGFEAGRGWVVFLDSDDWLVEGAGPAMQAALEGADSAIVFFRCIDQDGVRVGTVFDAPRPLDLETYITHTSFGEALTAVDKDRWPTPPYIAELRGYEGIGCTRIIAATGPAVLSDVVARVYDTSGADRLSASRGMARRLSRLARGHRMMVREFGRHMSAKKILSYYLKAFAYDGLNLAYRMTPGK